ncbi:MAG: thioredoxin domain-containing protein [Bacteroidetes bacterium]|nr:thioredoxin domain-containing protein [Bacteroidota bacterium]
MPAHTNRLAAESSPYLLQHAHNPVDWYPWGEEAFAKARAENKLVLISIGYSTCHWCHVMEHECFEDAEVAKQMNARFVCIKVDREERPDIDQVYMAAVQLMTGRGGWPLNCFTLPDGRPVYGGTYFPKEQWLQVLDQLADKWASQPRHFTEYAEKLHAGIRQAGVVRLNEAPPALTRKQLDQLADGLDRRFDTAWGGPDQAPKFPLPNTYTFLLRYGIATDGKAILKQVRLTLDKMAQGGIFDQIGGGFARYSTDISWKVPHFEKMLYDNAQLISLYSKAYQAFRDEEYHDVVRRTVAWAVREMQAEGGGWHSALDADSEGVEGLFYLWTEDQLEAALGEHAEFAKDFYNVGGDGYWEEGRNILLRTMDDQHYARKHGLTAEELSAKRALVDAKLLAARAARIRPGLDNKVITAWNAMMASALCDAAEAFGEPQYREMAEQTLQQLLTLCRRPDGGLWHGHTNGKPTVNGYLDDYSFTLEALAALYQLTFNERWLTEARALADYAIKHFLDEGSGMFRYTNDTDPPLIASSMEVHDNVIPSSNSSMAKGLFTLGHLLDEPRWLNLAKQQLANVAGGMKDYPAGHTNWALLLMDHLFPYYEIAITGPEALSRRGQIGRQYHPGRLFIGTASGSNLPLLADKPVGPQTVIYVCEGKVCQLPVHSVEAALIQMQ